MIFSCVIQD